MGISGLPSYKRVHRLMFGPEDPDGEVLADGPPESLILRMIGAVILGGLAMFSALFD